MVKAAKADKVRHYNTTRDNTLLITHCCDRNLRGMPCKVASRRGSTMAKMLNYFQEHGKDMISKSVKRVFVMLGVCDLVDNSV